jgi:cell division protein FtsB
MKIISNKTWTTINKSRLNLAVSHFEMKNELFKQEAKINTLIRENNELKRQINELKK